MQKIQQTIHVNAPRETVWNMMLSDATYCVWTTAFYPGSYYKGDWSEGSKMLFLAPGGDGEGEGGLSSRIKQNVPYERVTIEHLGVVMNGIEDLRSPISLAWKGALESYHFSDKDGGTELTVELDVTEEEYEHMNSMWANALDELKKLAEGSR